MQLISWAILPPALPIPSSVWSPVHFFPQGAGAGGEGLWINPNSNATASHLALGQVYFLRLFVDLTFIIAIAMHSNCQSFSSLDTI